MSASGCSDAMPEDTTPLRIVHLFRSPVGGIFRHVRDLVEAQHAAGHLVGIVCDSSTGGEYEDRLFDTIRPKLALGLQRLGDGGDVLVFHGYSSSPMKASAEAWAASSVSLSARW